VKDELLFRWWCARRDGEIVVQGVGPDVEAIARAVAGTDGTVAFRDAVKPTKENGWAMHGPWIDVE
jgi:hypothetical protein